MRILIAILLSVGVLTRSGGAYTIPQYLSQPIQLWNLSPADVSELLSRQPLHTYREVSPRSRGGAQPPQLQDYETWYTPESEHQNMQPVTTYGPSAAGHQDIAEEAEISQFHTQDGEGRTVFGYNTPDQVRIEARTADGKVRGSYSYLDPFGRTIKVQYWDDGFGFHAAGNSIPNAADLPQPVTDTPEVQAAKKLHEQLYAKALQASSAQPSAPDSGAYYNDANDRHDTPSYEASSHHRYEHQVLDEGPSYSDLPPVYDEDGTELRRYPKLPHPAIIHDPSHQHDVESDAVVIENPGLPASSLLGNLFRQRRSAQKSDEKTDRNGFFYSFHYPAPLLVNVKTHHDEVRVPTGSLSVSQRATLFGAIPVAAVHDAQLAPGQEDPHRGYSQRHVFTDPHQRK